MMAKAPVRTIDSRQSILSALDDQTLFAPHFKGDSWDAWRAFLTALFALLMDDATLALYRLHTGRQEPPSAAFTEADLIVGRRGGKSRVLATIAVFLATFRYVSGLLKSVPLLAPMVTDESNVVITLNNRVVIEIGTASFRATRGYTYAAVLADEIAFWRSDETSANPDIEIMRALRPGMASIPGAILLKASSPYAKRGALYADFRRYYGRDDGRVLVWKASTEAMNPRIDPAIIAEAYEEDPEAARAEYGAEFRDDLADFVTREIVDAVTAWDRHELPPQPGITYAAFCDPSGGASDSMTLAVGHLRDGSVCVLDATIEIRAPFDPEAAVGECAELLRRFGILRVIGDRYAGEWPKARFREHGIEFQQSARAKSDLYLDLLPLLNAKRVELLDVPRLAAQLVGLERRTARSGRDSVDHTPGGKDDLANAVAGVLVGLDLDRRPGLVRQGDLMTKDAPLPLPLVVNGVFAAVAVSKQGTAAVVYFAAAMDGSVLIMDFDAGPLAGDLFGACYERLHELSTATRARAGIAGLFTEPELVRQASIAGLRATAIPDDRLASEALLLPAGLHIAAGRVKICEPAHEKAKTNPFGGALDFKGGELGDDPLRRAALWAISLGLDEA